MRRTKAESKIFPSKTNANWNIFGILAGFLLILWTWPTCAHENEAGGWRPGYEGYGTTHEQMGQRHWAEVEYTEYAVKPQYTKSAYYPTYGMQTVFNLSRYLFDNILYDDPAIPPGYVVVKGQDNLALGPKVETNDWHALVGEYWLILFFLFFLLTIIILLPFIAVCYCCFCFCHHCSPGCPPCDRARDLRRCIICGFLLLILIILILVGAIVAYFCTRLLDRGIRESKDSMRQGTQDVCTFLKDVKEHVHHLFANNYEELASHLTDLLTNAHKHISVDIGDVSEANALEELERILNNMPKALTLMKEVMKHEQELRFLGDQLRDALRGIKRDINHLSYLATDHSLLLDFFKDTEFQYIDTSICLHFDELPDTSVYVQGIREIMDSEASNVPTSGIERFKHINDVIAAAMVKIAPALISDIAKGRDIMLKQANRITELLEAIISDIHINSLRSTRSFEDFYDKYGIHRTIINICAVVLIFVILVALITALVCGCFASRTTGAACLLLAIMLIFCAISFITLVGLFYFVIGIVTYHGGCAPFKDQGASEVFRKLDTVINPNRFIKELEIDEANPPLRMSNAMAACEAHQSIFNLLTEHHIYDINDLTRITIMRQGSVDVGAVQADLSDAKILIASEAGQLEALTKGNLSSYHSKHYLKSICDTFLPFNLGATLNRLTKAVDAMGKENVVVRLNLITDWEYLAATDAYYIIPMRSAYNHLKNKLQAIDKLILYNNLEFGPTISVLLTAVLRSEKFIQIRGKDLINSLIANLTDFTHSQVEEYIDKVITDANTKVGLCEPLAYIYFRSVDVICGRLVDPINGFWMGILFCAILFLPVLFVAHRLLCLFKKHLSFAGRTDIVEMGRPCPVCTGIPYVAPPAMVCSGVQQKHCVCSSTHRSGGGVNRDDVLIFQDHQPEETFTEAEEDPSFSKRKRD